jgi:hypothetical protein
VGPDAQAGSCSHDPSLFRPADSRPVADGDPCGSSAVADGDLAGRRAVADGQRQGLWTTIRGHVSGRDSL